MVVEMSREDNEYYRRRAETERALASAADRTNVAEIHEELARLYEALADQAELRPMLGIVVPARPSIPAAEL